MTSLDLLKMSCANLWRRKLRTFLTMLGVVIGTSSIILMLSLGFAMDASFKESLQQMGSLNTIQVYRSFDYYSGSGAKTGRELKLDESAVASFQKIPGVEAVMPIKNAYLRVIDGKMVGDVSVIGIDPALMETFDFQAEEGRLLMAQDKDAMVFGKQVAFSFRNPRQKNQYPPTRVIRMGGNAPGEIEEPEPPVNLINDRLMLTTDMSYGERRDSTSASDDNYIPPSPTKVKGVGLLKSNMGEEAFSAYMNIATLEKIMDEERRARKLPRNTDEDKYSTIKVKVNDIQLVEAVQNQINKLGYQSHSLADMLNEVKKEFKVIQAILGGIGAVSLLVAAIGITNTMVMSIYERTREIGVMKVLGANLRDIRRLFLLEAGMIGLFGGFIGICCSSLISSGLNLAAARFINAGMGGATKISIIPLELVLSAVFFSTIVGLIAGYSPANRAMKLSVLDAIRTD